MTAENWEPSAEITATASAYLALCDWDELERAIKAVRDLIIDEARPEIEAAERERIAKQLESIGCHNLARDVRALNGATP